MAVTEWQDNHQTHIYIIYIYVYITQQPAYMLSKQQEFRLFPKTNGKLSVESQETEIYFLRKHGLFALLRVKLKAA